MPGQIRVEGRHRIARAWNSKLLLSLNRPDSSVQNGTRKLRRRSTKIPAAACVQASTACRVKARATNTAMLTMCATSSNGLRLSPTLLERESALSSGLEPRVRVPAAPAARREKSARPRASAVDFPPSSTPRQPQKPGLRAEERPPTQDFSRSRLHAQAIPR
jgi:hypothetical protein